MKINMAELKEAYDMVYSRSDLKKDFAAFNFAIDMVKEKFGYDEDTAVDVVSAIWDFPMVEKG